MPSSLNFFNFSNARENLELKPMALDISANNVESVPGTSTDTLKQETCQKNVTKVKPVVSEKKKMPSTIHKNIRKLKTATSTVQALKKKYQEQRLAKQRIENKLRATCVRTRSCTERAALNTKIKLAPKKFLPQIRTKRHGLRSGLLLNKADKSLSKTKIAPVKPKKKINLRLTNTETPSNESPNTAESFEQENNKGSSLSLNKADKSLSKAKITSVKPKKKINSRLTNTEVSNTESSNTDETLEDEDNKEGIDEDESQSEKVTSQIKQNTQKSIQKKICTRSKSGMRRVTRSYSGTISPKNISTRPTRKTKEAATVYMEILGRKLIQGSELETEDNISVESYPELPNVRKLTQTENEIKSKMKQTAAKTVSKSKDCKVIALNDTKRIDKNRINKLIQMKSKRLTKMQTYCEEDSEEEESASSVEVTEKNNTRPITRLSVGKLDKPISKEQRSLRSSAKNTLTQSEELSNANNKPNTQVQNSAKAASEKVAVKRKRDQNPSKASSDTASEFKSKSLKNDRNEDAESEEETLGMLLSKMKKKKESEVQERIPDDINNTKDNATKHGEVVQNTKVDFSKVSDDEESFRGFTKKAISKVLDSCQTHANANLLVDEKLSYVKMLNIAPVDQTASSQKQKEETLSVKDNSSVTNSSNGECIKMSLKQHKSLLDSCRKTQDLPSSSSMAQTSKQCSHEDEVTPNLMDMPLSALRSRKERVNMSTERIEKWLNESSLAKEESKLEMENVSTFRYDSTEKIKIEVQHLSIPTKIQHLVRPVNVTLSKLMDKTSLMDRLKMLNNKNTMPLKSNADIAEAKSSTASTSQSKIDNDTKETVKNKGEKANKEASEDERDFALKFDQNSTDGSTEKKSLTEKKIFQPRKPFLPKVKERKTVTPNANAFSPENESSVYAFESDTEVPVSTPFRRKVKDTAKSTQEPIKKSFAKPGTSTSQLMTKPAAKTVTRSVMKMTSKPTAVVPAVASTSSIATSTRSMAASTRSATASATSTVTSAITSTVASTVTSAAIFTATSTVTSVATSTLAVTFVTPSTVVPAFKTETATEVNMSIVKKDPAIPNCSEKSTVGTDTAATKDREITAEAISVPNTALNLNNLVGLTNIKVLPLNKLVNNWNNENSSSIAVQVNFDENMKGQQAESDEQKAAQQNANQQKSSEISTQTDANNDDDDEQLFYIPLQAITRSGPNLQKRQVIQGVAVKLGTEGRAGPNQRVLLRAKLVTKSPLAMALHPPPVGTVQPTTRGPPVPPAPPFGPPGSPSSLGSPGQQRYLSPSLTTSSLKVAPSPVSVAITSIMATTNMVTATTPTNVVANTPITVVANTPTTIVATMPTTMVVTTPTTSSTVAVSTSSVETQPASPAISDAQVLASTSRQSNSASNSSDRLRRSPMSSRERKASVDSAKSGKRYIYVMHLLDSNFFFT